MKHYEKQLQYLITATKGGCEPMSSSESPYTEADNRFLSAKGFVALRPAENNEFYITLKSSGLVYFDQKAENRKKFIVEHFVKFLFGFISGVLTGLCVAWLIDTKS